MTYVAPYFLHILQAWLPMPPTHLWFPYFLFNPSSKTALLSWLMPHSNLAFLTNTYSWTAWWTYMRTSVFSDQHIYPSHSTKGDLEETVKRLHLRKHRVGNEATDMFLKFWKAKQNKEKWLTTQSSLSKRKNLLDSWGSFSLHLGLGQMCPLGSQMGGTEYIWPLIQS